MNSHFHTFTTSFYNDNVFCPRCLSYVAIEDIENHASQHERSNSFETLFNAHENIIPSRSRTRSVTMQEGPFSRLARLQSLYNLSGALFNRHLPTYSEDGETSIANSLPYELNVFIADLLGDVEVGISDIDKVSTLVDENSTCDCHICLEQIQEPRKLICEHIYCDKCIKTWLSKHKTCPICRKDLEKYADEQSI